MANETQAAGGGATQSLEGGSLLDEILAETKMTPGDEGYDVAKRGVQAFIAELVAPKREGEKVDKAFVDALIAEIDQKLSRQIDEILHNPSFQKLESAWRGLKFVVDRTDFRENIKVELLNCSKDDLLADFEDSPEVPKSGLYKTVYSAEFGTVRRAPLRRHHRQLRLRPRPAGHRPPPEVRRGRHHGARALHRGGGPAVLRPEATT